MKKEILSVAIDAAKSAGLCLKERFGNQHKIKLKREIDPVTDADLEAEKIIIGKIKSIYPDHSILSEESGETFKDSDFCWIIDPLDGTTNYSHNFPFFSVSIGLQMKGEIIAGVVYDPLLDELFYAYKGEGAYLNEKRIGVSHIDDLGKSLLATGFPYDIRESPDNNLTHFAKFIMKVQAVRRAGSAALDLCYVACGRLDGFWEMKLNPWDTAAALLIIKESGGKVTKFNGDEYSIYDKEILASNGLIHNHMIEILTSN
ncbi:MAG: inositol monophosphatase [Candidatus Schekmanbacteria bacterium]|nr:MAG: inositol monophosphatase [Candidatus Schekmanbacteria bacterium]